MEKLRSSLDWFCLLDRQCVCVCEMLITPNKLWRRCSGKLKHARSEFENCRLSSAGNRNDDTSIETHSANII